mgnify:CR=1 FL=1
MKLNKIFIFTCIIFIVDCEGLVAEENLNLHNKGSRTSQLIYNYIRGQLSYETIISNEKFLKYYEMAIEYIKLWKELDDCRIENYDDIFKSLENNFFSPFRVEYEYENLLKGVKYKSPAYKSLKEGFEKGKKYEVTFRKILKDLLNFKILILKEDKDLIYKSFSNIEFQKYYSEIEGNLIFYPFFIKLSSGGQLSENELLIIKNFKNKESPYYKLFMALYYFNKGNAKEFEYYLSSYEKKGSNNLFLTYFYKSLKGNAKELELAEPCFQKLFSNYLTQLRKLNQ